MRWKRIPQIVITEDGSITCADPSTGELYHNRAGAFTEALRNYVLPCALPSLAAKQSSLRILDACFGLGYNSFVLLQNLLSIIENEVKPTKKFCLDLLGLERDPQILELIPTVLSNANFKDLIEDLEKTSSAAVSIDSWSRFGCQLFTLGASEKLAVRFELRRVDMREELPRLAIECGQSFDFIFHDGFSPRRAPELWTIDLFAQYVKLLKPAGKIITYSSATAVRGALRELGLKVMRTASLGGKSGGTIAGWQFELDESGDIFTLTSDEETRLQSRSSIPYRDPNFSDTAQQITLKREQEVLSSLLPRLDRYPSADL